jgi:hypothetical protein
MAKPLISARTMHSLRILAERGMQNSCMIVRPVLVDDGAGNTNPHPDGPERFGPFPCSFNSQGGDEAEDGDQVAEHGDYQIGMPIDTPEVLATDEIELLGRTYQVVWTPPIEAMSTERTVGLIEFGREEAS